MNSPAPLRFDFYLQQLQPLLEAADTAPNPARFLYDKGARTPFFMLEALSRMYEKIYDDKIFGKLKKEFKALEDMLGAVDYYDAFLKQFQDDRTIPAAIKKYLKAKTQENLAITNSYLVERGWISSDNKRMVKIKKGLAETGWEEEKADRKKVKKQYIKFIEDIIKMIDTNEIDFTNVEEDVHELRRRLRWLSIYPQCFRGLFQLRQVQEPSVMQKKYLVPEIVDSSFNKMPAQNVEREIALDANNFYALSWMIAELGKLKDSGLKIIILKEAILATTKSSEKQADLRSLQLAGEGQMNTPDILSLAKRESDTYFNEGLLGKLVLEE